MMEGLLRRIGTPHPEKEMPEFLFVLEDTSLGKRFLAFVIIFALLFTALGCANTQNAKTETLPQGITFTDALGYSITVDNPQKVAAVTGSFAETWLLAGGELAALTEDAYSERGIEPSDTTEDLGAMKSPDVERMILAGIDFVILSAKISEHVKLRDTLEQAGMTTAYFSVETFDDYLAMLEICTDITGRADLYETNGTTIQRQIDAALAKKEGEEAPSVLLIRAYSTGAKAKGRTNMTGAMLEDLLEELSLEEIILNDPDYIFVTTMGASEEAALQTLAEWIQASPAWSELSAVKNGRYFVLPRNLFHYKPNNRWGESYTVLAEILYGS
jgi:iron complex transport system substrate-binding protein